MNFMGKIGSSTGDSSRQQGGEDHPFGEDQEEKGQPPTQVDRLLSSFHHQHSRHQQQQQPFLSPPPAFHNHRGVWLMDTHGQGGEPSSRFESTMHNSPLVVADGGHEVEEGGRMIVEREHMFDKVVTPSDVGKLNRLVIPKQHAERYFPLDSSTNDKGLLLNFEDRNGKLWRFRYSYWNSSQSYVMTKGWSRFVKDKKLDAGDIVSFQRGVGVTAKDRLFIDWRRRLDSSNRFSSSNLSFPLLNPRNFHARSTNFNVHPWNPLVLQSHTRMHTNLMLPPPNANPSSYTRLGPFSNGSIVNVNKGGSRSLLYYGPSGCGTPQQQVQMVQMQQRSGYGFGVDPPLPAATSPTPPALVFESVPPVHGKAFGKRLRLFGVNMDCPIAEEVEEEEEVDDQDYETAAACNNMNPIPMGQYNQGSCDRGHSPPLIPASSSSFSTIPYLQLRPHGGGAECNQSRLLSSSSAHAFNMIAESTASNMSLDLDI